MTAQFFKNSDRQRLIYAFLQHSVKTRCSEATLAFWSSSLKKKKDSKRQKNPPTASFFREIRGLSYKKVMCSGFSSQVLCPRTTHPKTKELFSPKIISNLCFIVLFDPKYMVKFESVQKIVLPTPYPMLVLGVKKANPAGYNYNQMRGKFSF